MATATEVSLPSVTIKDLLDAGLHFGHQTKRWNPKMKPFIFGKRNGIHIIDLSKSLALLNQALRFVYEEGASGKTVLFVGTKKQAQQVVQETAVACGQPYVTYRWLGGMLTNAATIRRSVKLMKELEAKESSGELDAMHKKEASAMRRELAKLRRSLTGVANMDNLPSALFVVDITREGIAVAEANRLGIPVVAVVDTCCDPDPIDHIIPGNDDAIRAIKLIAGLIGEAIKRGADNYAAVAAEAERKRAAKEEAEKAAVAARKAAAAAAAAAEGEAKSKAKAAKIAEPADPIEKQIEAEEVLEETAAKWKVKSDAAAAEEARKPKARKVPAPVREEDEGTAVR